MTLNLPLKQVKESLHTKIALLFHNVNRRFELLPGNEANQKYFWVQQIKDHNCNLQKQPPQSIFFVEIATRSRDGANISWGNSLIHEKCKCHSCCIVKNFLNTCIWWNGLQQKQIFKSRWKGWNPGLEVEKWQVKPEFTPKPLSNPSRTQCGQSCRIVL